MGFVYTSKGGNTTSPGLNSVITTFQVTDCEGTNVGDPIPVIQAVIMNKGLFRLCNPQDIIGDYNRVTRTVLGPGGSITLDADTYHSIGFKVISGAGKININGAGNQDLDAGESDNITASTLIDQEIIIECTSGKVVVTTLESTPV